MIRPGGVQAFKRQGKTQKSKSVHKKDGLGRGGACSAVH